MTTLPMAHITPRKVTSVKNTNDRDLVSITDFTPEEITSALDLASAMKVHPADFRGALAGKQVVMFFEKPSLRTRITFESGISSLGGVSFFVDQGASRLGAREPLSDIAHNLERWVDGIVLRTFAHDTCSVMAEHSSIPVINALSDHEHPCQALADVLTLKEHFGSLRKLKVAFVGDGNNVAHSLMLACASVGANLTVGTPKGYEPSVQVLKQAQKIAKSTGATIDVTTDAVAAVTGAQAIYTDVWASMGQESEAAERQQIFLPFQVNAKLMSQAAKKAKFMHCLPAHRGDEVTADVIDSPSSVVFDQAENRLHAQKAILLMLLGGGTAHRFPSRSAHA
ncbi:ornithine carbamoyltransferase [Candidatus Koribacter versatilis Ellin345]|uniref:Ornithine carbamoyltransferase n=1 Tax=Koribacter versatilis (strain Ellin345) TaxID=204669 RepID=Q1IIZ1_KORVE|nr:ornithine carbamoyltransferase [Candidatus Koribacter versatilis]ABF43159.1 ornithine carbamoyltransferase [Candidatus Koribacter versatilis Ellin345]